jgi:uncharacterized membrane protein (UPF0127 family)
MATKTKKLIGQAILVCVLMIVMAMIGSFFSKKHHATKFHAATIGVGGELTRDLYVEVVSTPAEITQGLSGRDVIGSDGMLFVFDEALVPSFWMKEMRFPLDMVWIRDGVVVDVHRDVPAPGAGTAEAALPRYQPSEAVDMVLELPAGSAQEWGVAPGSSFVLMEK